MTATVYLVYRAYPEYGFTLVNGVTHVLVNSVSTTDAKLNAVLACDQAFQVTEGESEANNVQDAFDAGYFDSTLPVCAAGDPPGSGILSADGDAIVFPERSAPVQVLGTSYTPVG